MIVASARSIGIIPAAVILMPMVIIWGRKQYRRKYPKMGKRQRTELALRNIYEAAGYVVEDIDLWWEGYWSHEARIHHPDSGTTYISELKSAFTRDGIIDKVRVEYMPSWEALKCERTKVRFDL